VYHCDVVNLLLFVPIRTTSCLPPSSTYGGSNAVRRRHCILPAARRWHSCWHGVAPSPRRLAPPPLAPARRQPLGDRAKRSPRAPWWRDDNKCTCKCLKARARYLRTIRSIQERRGGAMTTNAPVSVSRHAQGICGIIRSIQERRGGAMTTNEPAGPEGTTGCCPGQLPRDVLCFTSVGMRIILGCPQDFRHGSG
jgi:hypothetical protein